MIDSRDAFMFQCRLRHGTLQNTAWHPPPCPKYKTCMRTLGPSPSYMLCNAMLPSACRVVTLSHAGLRIGLKECGLRPGCHRVFEYGDCPLHTDTQTR